MLFCCLGVCWLCLIADLLNAELSLLTWFTCELGVVCLAFVLVLLYCLLGFCFAFMFCLCILLLLAGWVYLECFVATIFCFNLQLLTAAYLLFGVFCLLFVSSEVL